MRVFPVGFAGEKNKKGLTPVWLLKLTVGGFAYYLSDVALTITGWDGADIAVRPWIANWGRIQEQLSGDLNELRIADFDADFIIDPDAVPNMEDLVVADDLGQAPAILYLWFYGLDAAVDPPQEIAYFYARTPEIPDDITVRIAFEDEAVRLQKYVGERVTTEAYPSADPDDIGKVLPLVFGSVAKLPALALDAGVMTTLAAALSSGVTSVPVADPRNLTVGKTITVESEEMYIHAVAGSVLTVTRGYGGTAAAAHSEGTPVFEKKSTPFVFVCSARPLSSLPKVYCRYADGLNFDITAHCSRYTGQSGSQLAGYGSKACVSITQTQAKTIRELIMAALVKDTIDVSNPDHLHGYSESREQIANNLPVTGNSNGTTATATPTYPAVSGISEQTNQYTFSWAGGSASSQIVINGVTVYSGASSGSGTWAGTTAGSTVPTVSHITSVATNKSITISAARRTVVFASSSGSTAQATAKIGGVNSYADQVIGGAILVDAVSATTAPAAVATALLAECALPAATMVGAFPAGYAFNGAITEYKRAGDWLQRLAFQCRAWFRLIRGTPKLIVRPDALTPVKTLPACRTADGRKVFARRPEAVTTLINRIHLLYDRDWTKAGDDKGYKGAISDADEVSITRHGERERPDLFRFDFVTSPTMAASLLAFYLGQYSRRAWLYEFEVFLDHCELEFADAVALGFHNDTAAEILSAGFSPGSAERIDVIRFLARG